MTKKVVWTSCSRLSCACLSSPTVILCLSDSALLAAQSCPDDTEMPYAFTTLEATLTKSWKTANVCQQTSWSYAFSYDETLLADPDVALLQSDIVGVFCEGCLTTWITEKVGDEISVELNDLAGTVTIVSQHGCSTAFNVGGGSPTVDWHILGNLGIIDGTNFCGTGDNVAFDVRTNNKRSRRTEPFVYASTTGGNLDAPNILDGGETNAINFAVSATLSGGGVYAQSGFFNAIAGTGLLTTEVAFGSTIGGGAGNTIDPDGPPDFDVNFLGTPFPTYDYGGYSTIAGGGDNRITWDDDPSALGAGFHTIGGGQTNNIERAGGCATIGGGYINFITYDSGILDDFYANQIAGDTLSGGVSNLINGPTPDTGPIPTDALGANFIGGGTFNQVDNGWNSTVTGGWTNIVTAVGSAYTTGTLDGPLSYDYMGGGAFNSLIGCQSSTILGGTQSKILGESNSEVLGGFRNVIYSTTLATPPITGGSSFNVTYPSATTGAYNIITGGYANYLEDAFCSSIIGGAGLRLGKGSAGFQCYSTRSTLFSYTPGDAAVPYDQFNSTNYSEVTLAAFPNIFYLGDVDSWIANTDGVARKLKFIEPNTDVDFSSANYSSVQAQAQGANIEYVLPASAGTAGQSLKIQSVVGVVVTLEWA